MRPSFPALYSTNHNAPSGPIVMSVAPRGTWNTVITPAVVMRPTKPAANHSAPSGPVVRVNGKVPIGIGNSVIAPSVVMRPMRFVANPVYHSAPSGPAVMPQGSLLPLPKKPGMLVGRENSVITPAEVMRAILLLKASVNHRAPSGPAVIVMGLLEAVGIGNSLKVTASVRPARPPTAHSKTIIASSTRR